MSQTFTIYRAITLELVVADIRSVEADVVVFGRNRELRNYYERLAGKPFAPLDPLNEMDRCTVVCYDPDLLRYAVSFPYNPPVHARRTETEETIRLRKRLEVLFGGLWAQFRARRIALTPLTWRHEKRVADATIHAIRAHGRDLAEAHERGAADAPQAQTFIIADLVSVDAYRAAASRP